MTSQSSLIAGQNDGWIEHDGKGMPVDGGVLVYVRFPDGYEDTADKDGHPLEPSHAEEWGDNWLWPAGRATFGDIVAYRIHTPSPPRAKEDGNG